MKSRSRRLEPVARVAESREREAARRLGESWRVVLEQQSRLDELVRYRDGYASVLSDAAIGAAQLQQQRAFIGRLNDAVRAQEELIRNLKVQSEHHRNHWLAKRGRMMAIDAVLEKCRNDERQRADKREQQQHDERGGRVRRRTDE